MTASGYLESLPDARLVELWLRRRAGRIPAGSHNRQMAALRTELLSRGLWRAVYDVLDESG